MCKITVTLDYIFRIVLCGHEGVSFKIICLNVLEGNNHLFLLMWFKNRLEIPFKGNNVNIKRQIENLVLYFSEKVQKIAASAMLFFFFFRDQTIA